MKIYLKSIFALAIFVTLSLTSFDIFGQKISPSRVRTYDVQNYIIRSKFDQKKKIYYGDSTIQLKPLSSGFKQIVLDSVGMKFSSITFENENKPISNYVQKDDKLIINLDNSYSPGDLLSIRFVYTSSPKKGVYFVDEEHDGKVERHSAQVWTQGEAEEARYWFPSYDFPDDKATTEQYITIAKDMTAISNGELIDTVENADGTKTVHYKMSQPHSVYLTSFVVGRYSRVEGKYRDVPLGFYVYPGKESIVENAFGKTANMIGVYEKVTGVDFPYHKYDQTIVAHFNFGGMENITATTMADTEILFAEMDFGRENAIDLVSHELAHSWFGDLVTTKDWSNLWLNEGFATYMECVYRENLNGRKDYLRKVTQDAYSAMAADEVASSAHPLLRPHPPTDDSLFDTTTYKKGGAVLHTLREEVGTDIFWKAINLYLNRFKFANVESEDLRKAMEEASGKDLKWFFDQWVYKSGFPRITAVQSYKPLKKQLVLKFSQNQLATKTTPSVFTLPLDIEIQTATETKTEKITVDKRTQTFTIKTDGKPTKITIDKDLKIPLKILQLSKG